MDATVKKLRWFWAWQDDREEDWLGEMSRKGLHMVSPGFPGVYTFSTGEPKDYVYRLDYRTFYKKGREEYLQLFRDAGWEYLGQLASWQYFRKDTKKEGVTEIFTDNESKIAKYRRVISYLSLFYIFYGIFLWSRLISDDAPGWTDAIIWIMAAMLIFMTYAVINIILRMRKLGKQ